MDIPVVLDFLYKSLLVFGLIQCFLYVCLLVVWMIRILKKIKSNQN